MSCCVYRQRRTLVPWRICLSIFTIISIIVTNGSATDTLGTETLSSSSSLSSSPRKTLNQEIGSPSELAWQAWLLVENKGGSQSALDSSNILRRITPKSIFIAPELIACPSGYSTDGKGVCKPDPIKIDEDAQRQFFLKRLNALYGKLGNNRKKPADPTGPLQINIPLSLPSKGNQPETQPVQSQQQSLPTTQKPELSLATEDRVAIPVVISQQPPVSNNNKSQEAVAVVIYKLENETKKDTEESVAEEEKTSFFLGSTNSSVSDTNIPSVGQVVPVAEILDDANHTFVGVVDYKTALNLKTVLNKSNTSDQTKEYDVEDQFEKVVNTKRPDSTEDSSPTVVLLLSPTKLPFVTTTEKETESSKIDYIDEQISTEQVSERIERTTVQTTEDQTKSDSTIQTVAPLETQTVDYSVDSTTTSTERAYTQNMPEDETVYSDEETQTEQESEEYDDTTDGEQDDFGESEDEILKPGEAGMMITTKSQDMIRSKNSPTSTIANLDNPTSTTSMDTTTMPTFPTIDSQDSLSTSDSTIKPGVTDYTRDDMTTQTTELPSTITTITESSTVETTTYKPRVSKIRTRSTTPSVLVLTTDSTESSTEKIESKDTYETDRDLVTEPEVIFSTQNSHSMTTAYGRKRPTHPAKLESPYTFGDFEDVITKTELPPLSDFHRRNPSSDRRPQKPSIIIHDESILFNNDGEIPSDFRDQIAQSSKASPMDFKRLSSLNDESSYIRFPEQTAETRIQQQTYVKFPSDEVNSIHNQDSYKDLLSAYSSRNEYNNDAPSSSTKSSVLGRPKPTSAHWRLPLSSLRMDRQHQQSQQQQQIQTISSTNHNHNNQRQQKQRPTLLKFWGRMPLIRDLNFYPITSHGSHNEPIGGQDEQNNNRFNSRLLSSIVTPSPAHRLNYYNEMMSHDVNRLLLGRPAIGG